MEQKVIIHFLTSQLIDLSYYQQIQEILNDGANSIRRVMTEVSSPRDLLVQPWIFHDRYGKGDSLPYTVCLVLCSLRTALSTASALRAVTR